MEKLVVVKIEEDNMLICGHFNSKEEALEYLAYVKNEISSNMQSQYAGEYLIIPCLHFDINK